jgi:hypothetical protein
MSSSSTTAGDDDRWPMGTAIAAASRAAAHAGLASARRGQRRPGLVSSYHQLGRLSQQRGDHAEAPGSTSAPSTSTSGWATRPAWAPHTATSGIWTAAEAPDRPFSGMRKHWRFGCAWASPKRLATCAASWLFAATWARTNSALYLPVPPRALAWPPTPWRPSSTSLLTVATASETQGQTD